MSRLPPGWPAGQSLYGTAQQTPTLAPTPLCGVQVPTEFTASWSLTCYATRRGGAVVNVPTNPAPLVFPAPYATDAAGDPVLHIRIGTDLVVIDYPHRGGIFTISPTNEVQVSVLDSWAGGAPPAADAVPTYAARLTPDGYARSSRTLEEMPRLTVPLTTGGGLPIGALQVVPVPVRAVAVSLLLEQAAGGASPLSFLWRAGDGGAVGGTILDANRATFGAVQQPWVVPRRASQLELSNLAGVVDLEATVIWHIEL